MKNKFEQLTGKSLLEVCLELSAENNVLKQQLKNLEIIIQNFNNYVATNSCLVPNKIRGKSNMRVAEYKNGLIVNVYSSELSAHKNGRDKLSNIQYGVKSKKHKKWKKYEL